MRRTRSLPVALAGVFAVSFYSYAQLGGPQGIDVPYSGVLEDAGALVTDADVDFRFRFYDSAGAVTACDTVDVTDVVVANGRFALVIDDIAQACVVGKDVHFEIGVDRDQAGTMVDLSGRQRVFPSLAAMTSGTGDFAVQGSLAVTGPLNVSGASTLGTLTAGAVTATSISTASVNASGNVQAGTVTTTGDIRNTSINGQLGASSEFVFRDTGDNWLRLNAGSGSTLYRDLAVGQLYAQGDFLAEGNTHGSCSWTGWSSASIGIASQAPQDCPTCGTLNCPTGSYVAAQRIAHYGGDTNYWTGIRVAAYCCKL